MKKFLTRILYPLLQKLRGTKSKWPVSKLVKGNMDLYESRHGYRFDINNPVTFTEKLQWYKIYYDNGHLEKVVDKAFFKDYPHADC